MVRKSRWTETPRGCSNWDTTRYWAETTPSGQVWPSVGSTLAVSRYVLMFLFNQSWWLFNTRRAPYTLCQEHTHTADH